MTPVCRPPGHRTESVPESLLGCVRGLGRCPPPAGGLRPENEPRGREAEDNVDGGGLGPVPKGLEVVGPCVVR